MSLSVNLVFPHQLFEENPLFEREGDFILIEEYLFFRQYAFHKQKIGFHRASMKFYKHYLIGKELTVKYIEALEEHSDIRNLPEYLASEGVKEILCLDPCDDWLERRLRSGCKKNGITLTILDSPSFLNSKQQILDYFRDAKAPLSQTSFYIEQRKKRSILLNAEGKPEGGKWSLDAENRKKFPAAAKAPEFSSYKSDYHREAEAYVKRHFSEHPGELAGAFSYPIDFESSKTWLNSFLEERFEKFGDYEDAIVREEPLLHHSLLSPLINSGLLTPQFVLDECISLGKKLNVPINSMEGFIRQVMGWREFIRAVYILHGKAERTRNFWGFKRKIPKSFYSGATGIEPIDETIQKVLSNGYCHHIERLMILGNFMLLCEFDPDEVYRWFMELFIDAYDWVMVPNVYGMSQFADGGMMSTKPYISGSNYVLKMSDYSKGSWTEIWDGLFWRFMHVHRDFFSQNPRLGMLLRTLDKMDEDKRQAHFDKAEAFLSAL